MRNDDDPIETVIARLEAELDKLREWDGHRDLVEELAEIVEELKADLKGSSPP